MPAFKPGMLCRPLQSPWKGTLIRKAMQFANAYYLGGSPCCGKTTLSEWLVREFQFRYYSCDDHLYDYTLRGAAGPGNGVPGSAIMRRALDKDADRTWLRPPEDLARDEFQFYREAAAFIAADLAALPEAGPLLAEGAALTPEFARRYGIPPERCFYMVPTPDFQIEKYRQRQWAMEYMQTATQPEQAFRNWMERDILFARDIQKEAARLGLRVLVVDGSLSLAETYRIVCSAFGLDASKGKATPEKHA